MLFGLTNAPSTLQRLIQAVLAGLTREQCLTYSNDIIVFFCEIQGYGTTEGSGWSSKFSSTEGATS